MPTNTGTPLGVLVLVIQGFVFAVALLLALPAGRLQVQGNRAVSATAHVAAADSAEEELAEEKDDEFDDDVPVGEEPEALEVVEERDVLDAESAAVAAAAAGAGVGVLGAAAADADADADAEVKGVVVADAAVDGVAVADADAAGVAAANVDADADALVGAEPLVTADSAADSLPGVDPAAEPVRGPDRGVAAEAVPEGQAVIAAEALVGDDSMVVADPAGESDTSTSGEGDTSVDAGSAAVEGAEPPPAVTADDPDTLTSEPAVRTGDAEGLTGELGAPVDGLEPPGVDPLTETAVPPVAPVPPVAAVPPAPDASAPETAVPAPGQLLPELDDYDPNDETVISVRDAIVRDEEGRTDGR